MKKIALLGDFQTVLSEHKNVHPEILGQFLSDKRLTVVFDSVYGVTSSLSNAYHENSGKCIYITSSNEQIQGHQNCNTLVAKDELAVIDMIYNNSSELFFFPGGPAILSRLSYFWVKNTISNEPKQIYLVGDSWMNVVEAFKVNGIITDTELKFTSFINPADLMEAIIDGV